MVVNFQVFVFYAPSAEKAAGWQMKKPTNGPLLRGLWTENNNYLPPLKFKEEDEGRSSLGERRFRTHLPCNGDHAGLPQREGKMKTGRKRKLLFPDMTRKDLLVIGVVCMLLAAWAAGLREGPSQAAPGKREEPENHQAQADSPGAPGGQDLLRVEYGNEYGGMWVQ